MEENIFEQAEQLAESQRSIGIEMARRQMLAQTFPGFDNEHCIDCEEEIPAERLKLQRIRCTRCESTLETRNRHFRH